MSFFKKIVSKIKEFPLKKQEKEEKTVNEKEEIEIKNIENVEDFWRVFYTLKRERRQDILAEEIKSLLESLNEDIKKQLHRIIRTRLYAIDIGENENKEFIKHFVNFRIKMYNPLFKKSQDTRLAKLILTIISRYPDAIKSQKISDSNTSIFNKDDIEIQKLSNELLNMYKLTPSEVEHTIQKIIDYNRKNVTFTEEEESVLTNSELLRNLLESITFLLQDFVEKCNNWKKYFLKTYLFDDPALLKILNFDKKLLFNDKFEDLDFVEIVFTKNVKGELEPLVEENLKPLLKKDVSAVINRMKRQIIKEEKEFMKEITEAIAGNIVLLHSNGELPFFRILKSLMSKSFKFHQNYFPDLMKVVNSIKEQILNTLGEEYNGYPIFLEKYHKEIAEFVYRYSKDNFKITVDYAKFIELLEKKPKEKTVTHYTVGKELLPEELRFLAHSLDAEPAIMELNEKIREAERNIPIFEDEYFYSTKKAYIKTALLETLNTLLSTKEKGDLIHSVLMKTIETGEGESSKIALTLLKSMKTDAITPKVVKTLLKKQKAKNHITEKIKSLLIKENEYFYNNQENIKIELQKYSKLTGIGFFTATVNDTENYKITAHFKDGEWKITHFSKIDGFSF